MIWTVACFCGTLYRSAPDGRCPVCAESLPGVTGHAHGEQEQIPNAPSTLLEARLEVIGARA